jgi:hypothetical protein
VTLELAIPGLPPMNTAGPHGGSHWSRTATKRKWEGRVCVAVLEALGRWPTVPLEQARVTITRCSEREPDYDNLTQGGKFLLDGLVKARVLVDDSPKVIGRPDYRWEHAPRGAGCVKILVEASEASGHRVQNFDAPGTIQEVTP